MILKILLLMALTSISPSIKPEYLQPAMAIRIIGHESKADCDGRDAYYTAGQIHICGHSWQRDPVGYIGLLQHEVQHFYQFSYLILPHADEDSWSRFVKVCTTEIANPVFTRACEDSRLRPALMLETHALLPRYLGSELPPELQPWYPWLAVD